jgi:FkbM family methyltransferase
VYNFFKRILPARVRRFLRPLTVHFQQHTQRQNQVRIFSNFVTPGDLVFDIGANSGRMTEIFLGLGATVISIEPQPQCADVLRDKFAMSKRVKIVERGVGETQGMMPMNICGDIDEVSSFRADWNKNHYAAKWTQKITVPVTTLATLILDHGVPAFCKIDVEGFEPQVLRGLDRPLPFLNFEFHQGQRHDLMVCLAILANLGEYKFNYVPHHRQVFGFRSWVRQCDLLEELDSSECPSGDIYARLMA